MKAKIHRTYFAFSVSAFCALSTGCAHEHRATDANEKLAEQNHFVKIDSTEVKPGDRLDVFNKRCEPARIQYRFKKDMKDCRNEKIGEAAVVRNVDTKTVEISLDNGVKFDEQLYFERTKK